MPTQWYIRAAGREIGPVSGEQLAALAHAGRLVRGHEVRPADATRWVRAEQVAGLFPAVASAPPPRHADADASPRGASADVPAGVQAAANHASGGPAPSVAPASYRAVGPFPPKAPPPRRSPPAGQHADAPPPSVPPVPHSAAAAAPSVPLQTAQSKAAIDPFAAIGPAHVDSATESQFDRMQATRTAERRRKQRQRGMWLIASGAAVIVGVIGIIALAASRSGGPTPLPVASGASAKNVAANSSAADAGKDANAAAAKGVVAQTGANAASPDEDANARWIAAQFDAFEHGGLSVRVLSVTIERPLLKGPDGSAARPQEPVLLIRLEVENGLAARSVPYMGWGTPERAADVTLVDSANRVWKQHSYRARGYLIDGEVTKATIAPGGRVDDVIAFDSQAGDWRRLHLRLPGMAFGEPVAVRFEIPSTMLADASGPADAIDTDHATSASATTDGNGAEKSNAGTSRKDAAGKKGAKGKAGKSKLDKRQAESEQSKRAIDAVTRSIRAVKKESGEKADATDQPDKEKDAAKPPPE